MKRVFPFSIIAGLLIIFCAFNIASSAVITFDDLGTGSTGTLIANGYGGFSWNNFEYLDGTQFPFTGYERGIVSPNNVAHSLVNNTATIASSTPFTFEGAYFNSYDGRLGVEVRGISGGITKYTTSIDVLSFGATYYSFNYVGIDTLNINVFSSMNSINPVFVMDNFTYTTAGVPEPSIMLLLGSGLIGLIGFGRKKLS